MILCDAIYPCKKLSLSILVYTGHGIITEKPPRVKNRVLPSAAIKAYIELTLSIHHSAYGWQAHKQNHFQKF